MPTKFDGPRFVRSFIHSFIHLQLSKSNQPATASDSQRQPATEGNAEICAHVQYSVTHFKCELIPVFMALNKVPYSDILHCKVSAVSERTALWKREVERERVRSFSAFVVHFFGK